MSTPKNFYGRSDRVSLCIVRRASCQPIIGQLTKYGQVRLSVSGRKGFAHTFAKAHIVKSADLAGTHNLLNSVASLVKLPWVYQNEFAML